MQDSATLRTSTVD